MQIHSITMAIPMDNYGGNETAMIINIRRVRI